MFGGALLVVHSCLLVAGSVRLPYHSMLVGPPHMRVARAPLVARSRVDRLGVGPSMSIQPLVTLFKVEGAQCGEAIVRPEFEPFAVQFAGLQRGDCASLGYKTPKASRVIDVPIIGSIRVALYLRT